MGTIKKPRPGGNSNSAEVTGQPSGATPVRMPLMSPTRTNIKWPKDLNAHNTE